MAGAVLMRERWLKIGKKSGENALTKVENMHELLVPNSFLYISGTSLTCFPVF